ncbi:reprolysin family zinc metalloprotease [Rhizoctonia solani AG-3 Rhs1AP]|uniref:Disintegrin and metalloproteinase domain-containing protein B n=1 Tax=Rhizoctonia solani AG-3 Rhs1AP TaxID=1086054 RepID=X8JRC6_9AGAM|nr:reprolysin family zinc metalloprotease [Rhizoctonia solani AG-3 Rhs1AP]
MWYPLCVLALLAATVSGSSAPPRPLKRLAHPSTLALEILPRTPVHGTLYTRSLESPTLQHTDSLRLTLAAFGRKHRLHLRPNHHLIHPAARINHLGPDGSIIRTEPLLRSSILVYEGEVIDEAYTAHRLREDAAGGVSRAWDELPVGELGWARIMVHSQGNPEAGIAPVYEGAFSVLGQVYHILTRENYVRTRGPNDFHPDGLAGVDHLDGGLVIFRDSDMEKPPITESQTCSHDGLGFNSDDDHPVLQAGKQHPQVAHDAPWYDPFGLLDPVPKMGMLGKRDDVAGSNSTSNFANQIGNTSGCSKTQKLVYMGVAADCEYTSRYGGAQNATAVILNDWNTASSLYKTTFNMSLGIVELAMQDPSCPPASPTPNPAWNTPCTDSITLNDRLSLFSAWRGERGGSSGSGAGNSAGLWHLMSGCPTGTEVGVAWLGQLCNTKSSGNQGNVVSGTAVSTAGRTEWQVVAHEIGHNFGAIHDCTTGCTGTSACCPRTRDSCDSGSQFIMSPVSSSGEMAFSPCSIGNICSVLAGSVDSTCLQEADTATQTISLQMCGNGIVEAGEGNSDCDPGVGTNSTCCDSTTCKFRANAVCDPSSSSCCTDVCQFAQSTQVCRPSRDATCDRVEMCTGTSANCPTDRVIDNGTSCGSGSLACANGICTSPDLQCQTAGVSLNLTRACPSRNDRSCQVSCQDPRAVNQCIVLQANLVDGSPCGYGGSCSNGACQSGSALDTAKAWYTSNLQIAIPVTVVVGIIVLLTLWGCLRCIAGCCGCRGRNKGQRISSWVPPERNRNVAPTGAWNSGTAWSGAAGGPHPPPSTHQANHQRHSRGARSWGAPPSPGLGANVSPRGQSADPERRESVGSPGDGHAKLVRSRSHWIDDTTYNGPGYRG